MRSPRRTALGSCSKVVLMPSAVPAIFLVVMVNFCPKRRRTLRPASSRPVRILGPCRSARMARGFSCLAEAWRRRLARSACSSGVPWEKFKRAQSIPAAISRSIISAEVVAGPMVQTIFALRISELFGMGLLLYRELGYDIVKEDHAFPEGVKRKPLIVAVHEQHILVGERKWNQAVRLHAVQTQGRRIGEKRGHLWHGGSAIEVARCDLGDRLVEVGFDR